MLPCLASRRVRSRSLSTTATATSSVAGSPYVITAALGGLAAGNYSFSFVHGALTVTKATLTVTADDKTREYGDANPTLTGTITGIKNSEPENAVRFTSAPPNSP